MELTIKRGHQICYNDESGIIIGNTIKDSYIFTEETIYDLKNSDQFDWNKLFGFTDCLFPRIKMLEKSDERVATCDLKIKVLNSYICFFRPVHWQSARFVWRWNIEKRLFELTSYCYLNGYRTYTDNIFTIKLDKQVDMKIIKDEYSYDFTAISEGRVLYRTYTATGKPTKSHGYYLGFYFGGNQAAPKDIKIKKI